jgi:polar amino acid transport system substrate-binding protein
MRARYAFPAIVSVAALTLTGCVNNSPTAAVAPTDSSSATSATKDNAAAALLPAQIAKAGVLVIATSPNYPPNEFKDEAGKPIGWSIEMDDAIAARLGLKADIRIASFDNIIPGIVGGTIDMGESSFTDTVKREEKVDFVNYYSAGTRWASAVGKSVDPANACGLTVAVQATTLQDTVMLPAASAACLAAGKPPVKKLPFDTQDSAINAVVLGRADAVLGDSPGILYAIVKTKGKLQKAGDMAKAVPYGLAVAKDSGMAKAVQAAMQSMVDDGTYAKILDKWGVGDGGIAKITINAGGRG